MRHILLASFATALLITAAHAGEAPAGCGAQNGVFNWSDSPARACRDTAQRSWFAAGNATTADSRQRFASKDLSPGAAAPGNRTEFTFSGYAYFGIAAIIK